MKIFISGLVVLLCFLIPVFGVSQNCGNLPDTDWSFNQSACTPKTIYFYTDSTGVKGYKWEFDDGSISNDQNPIHNYANYGVYTVKLTITYKNGCTRLAGVKKVPITADKASVIVNRETAICLGQSVQLNTIGNGFDSCWDSNPTLVKTNNGYVATPTSPTTYVFKVRSVGANLVKNGDFNQANFYNCSPPIWGQPIGFSSEYFYHPCGNLYGPGYYTIGTNPSIWKKEFANCKDHTGGSGNGNMMIIDGAPIPNQKVWYQDIEVKKNTNYIFSTWLATINAYSEDGNPNYATLQFSIDDNVIGTPFRGPKELCDWDQFFTTWNSGNKSKIRISIVNLNTIRDGNDFALDDILFGEVVMKTDSIHVTVKTPVSIFKDATVCAGQPYKLPSGKIVSATGVYTETFKTVGGCDSSITTNLSVLDAKKETLAASICSGQSYKLPSGKLVSAAGTYTETFKTASGCDSIITTNLSVADAKKETVTASICAGQSYNLPSGKTVNTAGTYTETIKSISGCDSIVTVNLTVGSAVTINKSASVCAGQTYTLPSGKVVNTAGNYTETFKTSAGCDSIITTSLSVLDAKKETVSASICSGQSYILPSGKTVSTAGTYTETIKSVSGCDSVVTVNLTIGSAVTINKSASVCAGQTYTLPSGKVVNTAGNYTETFKTSAGCDSIITTSLSILDAKKETVSASICSGQSYTLPSGKTVSTTGTYTETVKSVSGCDSIVTVNLSIGSAVTVNKSASVCAGQTYTLPSGKIVNTAGNYTETFKTSTGCDSIITTSLSILDAKKETVSASICSGQSYTLPSGKTVSTTGTYTETVKSVSGCDSIVTVNLSIGSAVTVNKSASVCAGQTYTLPSGKIVNTAGNYTETFKTSTGCDSIITTSLSILDAKKETVIASICGGQSYTLPSGKTVNTAGTYTETIKSVSGCDSNVTVNLSVGNAVTVNKSASVCAGQTYTLPSGKIVNTTGNYTETFKTSTGCDSIITTNLSVLDAKKESFSASICAGQVYTLPSGKTVTTAGTYTETIKSVSGCDSVVTVNLTIGSAVTLTRSAVICAGESFTLPSGKVVSTPGSYTETIKSSTACDSIITVNLTVQEPKKETVAASICAGQSYILPSGKTVTTAGTYTETIKSVSGCDSVVTVNLTIGSAVTLTRSAVICAGESFTLPSGKVVSTPGSYTETIKSSTACDSIITVNLTVQEPKKEIIAASICGGQSYTLPSGKTVSTAGTYTETIKSVSGCDSVVTVNLTIGSAVTLTRSAVICSGESFTLPSGKVVSTSGSYTETIKSSTACDSIITVNLTVQEPKKETVAASICAGQSYILPSGKTVTTAGTYTETIKSVSGCDSVVTVNLTIGSAVTLTRSAVICAGESFTLPSGKVVSTSGSYTETIKSSTACDSIITVNLTVQEPKKEIIAASICSGQSYILPSGKTVTTAGTYTETVKSVSGCDSIVTVNLTVGSAVTLTRSAVICAGESFTLPSGKVVSTSGSYTETIKSSTACDSIITVNLTVQEPKKEIIAASICGGQSYTLPSGKTVSTAGTYTETIKSVSGCDSVVTVNLTIGSAVTLTRSAVICSGESFTLPSGKVVSTSGSYTETIKSSTACDSIITVNLTVQESKKETITASICAGQAYTLPSGKTVTTAGPYTETIKSVSGCDSVVTVNLTIGSAVTLTRSAVICAGESFTLPSGKVVSTSGSYTETVKSSTSCDSIITVNLTVQESKKETITASICAGQSYILPSGKTVSTAGTYTETIKSVSGCDSVVTVNLTIGSAVTLTRSAVICSGESFTLPSGKVVSTSGSYTETIKSSTACDSIITVNLTVQESKKETITASICAGQAYTLPSGKTVTTAGPYTETIKSVSGCDSVVTVNLTIGSAVTLMRSAVICAGESFTLPSGKVVSTSGSYTETIKSSTACDSIITVNLTVQEPKKEIIAASICGGQSYTLPSGKTVSTAGTYTETVKSASGCDSIVTVNLTVGSAVTLNKTATVCAGQSYILPSGKIVNAAGTYTETFKTYTGCDSIITTNLSVLESKQATINASICAGQSYTLPSGRTVSATGSYTETIKTIAGCDSVVTVNLTLGSAVTVNKVALVCPGQAYTLPSGRVVSTYGIYTETLKTAGGCDSIITTTLSVLEPKKETITATICAGTAYQTPSGNLITKAGTYTEIRKSTGGCDSLITTLNLSMTSVSKVSARAAICDGETYKLPWGKTASKSGIYTDTTKNSLGCDSILRSVTLLVRQKPSISIEKSNDINCIVGTATLTVTGGARYSWSPASSVSNPTASNPVVTPTTTTRYKVQVTSREGCVSEDSIDVIVNKGDADGGYLMPSAFTPNGDGKNDCFGVKSWGVVADLDFSVYSRWGELLFHTKDVNQCWDGTFKGVKQNSGTYVYQIFGTTLCGPVYRKGTIVLIR